MKASAVQGDATISGTSSVNVEPDRIAFVSNRKDGQLDIYVMNVDGTNPRRITSAGGGLFPSWSANGRQILYSSSEAGGIVLMNDDGSWPVLIAEDTTGIAFSHFRLGPAMSPEGRIAFVIESVPHDEAGGLDFTNFSSDIFLIDMDGGRFNTATTTPFSNEAFPSWSPDGAKIVYNSVHRRGQTSQIWVIETDTFVTTKRLFSTSGNEANPSFSPDGKRIVFSSTRDGDSEIFVMIASGLDPVDLTRNKTSDRFPSWSTDGTRRIVFQSNRDRNNEIYVMESGGFFQTNISNHPASDRWPRWAPRKSGVEVSEESVVIPNSSTYKSMTVQEVNNLVGPAVVRIETSVGAGSGFIIDPEGLILTNNHVIVDAETITVFLEDGTRYTGTVLGRDMVRDLAVIKIEARDLPAVKLGDVSSVSLGSDVLVIGYPLGFTGISLTKGSASGIKLDAGRNVVYVQTDATINPGNSGGPLLNMHGEVIGVVASKIVGGLVEDFGLAISVNTVKLYLERLKAGEVITN